MDVHVFMNDFAVSYVTSLCYIRLVSTYVFSLAIKEEESSKAKAKITQGRTLVEISLKVIRKYCLVLLVQVLIDRVESSLQCVGNY